MTSAACDRGGAQPLVLPQTAVDSFAVRVRLGDETRTLDLVRDSVRSQRFEVWIASEGGLTRALDVGPPATYLGLVREWPEARVSASLRSGGLFATVLGAPGDVSWAVEPAGGLDGDRRPLHVAYTSADLTQLGGICLARDASGGSTLPGIPVRGGPILAAELAFDADHAYYLLHGESVLETIASIEATVHTVNLIYEHQLDVRHELVGGFVRTDLATDPYAAHAGNASALHYALRIHWYQNHASFQRNAAHLFSGPSVAGGAAGFANIGSMCGGGFGVTMFRANPLLMVVVVAHELGHNWGACHCESNSGGSCNTYDPPNCSIMSSMVGKKPIFGPVTVATLLARIADFAHCLYPGTPSPAPALTAVQPIEAQVFGGDSIVLHGSSLDRVLYVHFDSQALYLGGFEVLDPTTIALSAPMRTTLGPARVSVQGPGGTSVPVGFSYVETSPPRIRGEFDEGYVGWGRDHVWTYGGRVGLQLDLLMSRNNATTGAPGLEILADATVVHSTILSAPGLGTYTQFTPQSWDGVEFWLQAVVRDGGQIVEVSELLYNRVQL